MRKKILLSISLIILIIAVASISFGFAANNIVKVLVEWKTTDIDAVIIDGKTYVELTGIADELNMTVDWDYRTFTANLRKKTNMEVKQEIKEIIEKARTSKPIEEGKAYIEISSPTNPVYWVVDPRTDNDHWFYTLVFNEINGVGLEVTEIRETYYTENYGGHYRKHNQHDIKRWWGTTYIKPYEAKTLTGGGNKCATKFMVWSIKGIDDNGNEVMYEYVLDMSQEPISIHKEEVFKDLYKALEGYKNIDKDKAFLDITVNKEVLKAAEGSPWHYKLTIEEKNGIDFVVDKIEKLPITYHGVANLKTYKERDFIKWWGTNRLENDKPVEITAGGPAERILDYLVWKIYGHDENGNKLVFSKAIKTEVLDTPNRNYSYDTINLRYNADFEVPLSSGVSWVPVNVLGLTNWTNEDMKRIAIMTPEEKQKKVDTLYEAIQLYQISNFRGSSDNKRIHEGRLNWEHHKPGYDAVRTNNGSCATSANWLNYILKNDYDEVGFIEMSQEDGSGHVINYIKDKEYYYVIDMTHYRVDFIDSAAVETGFLSDYEKCDKAAGVLFKVKDLKDYVDYMLKITNNPNEFYGYYKANNVPPIDSFRVGNIVKRTYPKGINIKTLYDKEDDNLIISYAEPPTKYYDFSKEPDAQIVPLDLQDFHK